MIVSRKIWLGLALVTTGGMALAASRGEAGESAERRSPAEPAQRDQASEGGSAYPGGTFESALRKMLAGEGGEGGIGLKKDGDTVSIPALTSAQIRQAIAGNTLRLEQHSAYYFDKSGTGQGWEIKWTEVDRSKCGSGADQSYSLEGDECWHGETMKLPTARWTVRDNKLCTDPAVGPVTGEKGCASVFFILNNVGLFEGDKLIGKGNSLHAGRQLEASPTD